jgi:hypothetical protein
MVLKGEDYDNKVKIKVEFTFEGGEIPSDYKDTFRKPGTSIRSIFAGKNEQVELETS